MFAVALMVPPAPMGNSCPTPSARVVYPVGWSHYEGRAIVAADRHGVPCDMFLRLLRAENPHGDPAAVNPASGAAGLGQFMPGTAAFMNVSPMDPHASINAAALYLRMLYDDFGDWRTAVAAYNFGPGNIRRWIASGANPNSLPAETIAYLNRIQP